MNRLTQIFRGQRDKAFVVYARSEAVAQLRILPYGVPPADGRLASRRVPLCLTSR
jgi:hypothetical protein